MGSSSSISLAIDTPSFVMVGAPHFFSRTTSRRLGPSEEARTMIARRARLPAVILFIVVAGACGPSGHAGSGDGGELRLHVADSGRSVILHPGERLTLNLGSSLHEHWLIVRY